jgi:hypothetical protein
MDILELINQSPLSKIEVNQTKKYIQITWIKQPQNEDFRKEVQVLTEYILAGNMNKVLYDVRERDYLEIGDQNWLTAEIFPVLSKHITRFAYVISPLGLEMRDVFRIHDLLQDSPVVEPSFEVDVFLDKEDAEKWLSNIH